MATKQSAGLLLYRFKNGSTEFFLVHPGGPFWKKKDAGAWSIPKGELNDDEDPLAAATREFREETGAEITGDFIQLPPVRQKGGKIVYAWALASDLDERSVQSNLVELEWPPRSGKKLSFPEIDQAAWFDLETARIKINAAQRFFVDELWRLLTDGGPARPSTVRVDDKA